MFDKHAYLLHPKTIPRRHNPRTTPKITPMMTATSRPKTGKDHSL